MSIIEFHRSTTREIEAVKDRIRLLVNHWGEDGKYKEKIFINTLRKFLPPKYNIASGFIVKEDFSSQKKFISSAQIDVIIYNSESPLLFKEGDFVIVTPESVEAIIEVKTNLENANPSIVINRMNEQGHFVVSGNKNKLIFNGIFSFEGFSAINESKIKEYYEKGTSNTMDKYVYNQYSRVNHIAFNKNWLLKYWESEEAKSHESIFVYKIPELSFSYFISSLLLHLSGNTVLSDSRLWFPADRLSSKIKFKI